MFLLRYVKLSGRMLEKKPSLLISCIAYGYGLDGNIRYNYQSIATGSFGQHSLLTTVNVIRAIIGAVGQVRSCLSFLKYTSTDSVAHSCKDS